MTDDVKGKVERLWEVRGSVNDWERGFIESVHDQAVAGGRRLSVRQVELIDKILAKNNPGAIEERSRWHREYDDEKRDLARKAAQYYVAEGTYYQAVAHKIINDPDYIPSEKCFSKMTSNKYVARYLAALEVGPRFEKGQMVQFRNTQEVRSATAFYIFENGGASSTGRQTLAGTPVIVLEVGDDPGITKGARQYKVLPTRSTGDTLPMPIKTSEKNLNTLKC